MDQQDSPEEIRELIASSRSPIGLVIGNVFGLVAAPTRHTVTIKSSAITLTHLEVVHAMRELTTPLPSEKALLLSLWLTPMTGHEQWIPASLVGASAVFVAKVPSPEERDRWERYLRDYVNHT